MCLNFKGNFSPLEQFEISSYNTNLVTTYFLNDFKLNSVWFDKGFGIFYNFTDLLIITWIIVFIFDTDYGRKYFKKMIQVLCIAIFVYILMTSFNLINFAESSFIQPSYDKWGDDLWIFENIKTCCTSCSNFFIVHKDSYVMESTYIAIISNFFSKFFSDIIIMAFQQADLDYVYYAQFIKGKFSGGVINWIPYETYFEYVTVLTSYINIYSVISCFVFIYIIVYLIYNKSLSNNTNTLIPTFYQIMGENLFKISLNLFYSILGKNISLPEFFIKINTIFIFLMLSNVQGMIPYMSTLTSALTNTFYIALALFISILSTLFNKKGICFFFNLFLPSGCPILLSLLIIPIELISYSFRLISLSVRLFANMMAGHTLLKVIVGFSWIIIFLGKTSLINLFPILILMVLILLEFGVALIQAYIFTVLSCIYLRDIFENH